MIVVVGGTGRLGTLVVRHLVDAGEEVRIAARDPGRAAETASLDGVSTVAADVRHPATLGPALEGARTVVSAVQGFAGGGGVSPASVDDEGNRHLVDAAGAAGADLVLVSVVGAAPDSPMELFRSKDAAERYAAASGVPTTVVAATAFTELWVELLRKTGLVFGRGRNPINFVSVGDVAAVVAHAATDPTVRGRSLAVGGPENLTFEQLAVLASPGRKPRHVPRLALRAGAGTVGRVNAGIGRQLRAALAMDEVDLTFDGLAARAELPWPVPLTTAAEVVAG